MEIIINKKTSNLIVDRLLNIPEVNIILVSYCDALGLDINKITLSAVFKLIDISNKDSDNKLNK